MNKPGILVLTPLQSVSIHGWMRPKRTLTWKDIVENDSITPKSLVETFGIKPECLPQIQPDIRAWIDQKYVSYEDVPYMTSFPLNPIEHLNGDISTLVTQQYSCRVLSLLGFTYEKLRDKYQMDTEWMARLNLSLGEWVSLGLTMRDVQCMRDRDVKSVFGAEKDYVCMQVGIRESGFVHHHHTY